MSDRTAFLLAIEAEPADDAPRLVFADWLEENDFPEGDRDRATADFIRVGCAGAGSKKRQTNAEGRWLEGNWRRLIPGAAHHPYYKPRREGRWLHVCLRGCLRGPQVVMTPSQEGLVLLMEERGRDPTENRFWYGYAAIEFWRGFLRRAIFDSVMEMEWALPVLGIDQPLIEPETGLPSFPPDAADVTRLTHAEMGAAFEFVQGDNMLIPNYTDPPDGTKVFFNDPVGKKVKAARAAAFRDYARSMTTLPAQPEPAEAA